MLVHEGESNFVALSGEKKRGGENKRCDVQQFGRLKPAKIDEFVTNLLGWVITN